MKSRLNNCLVLMSGMTSISCQMVSVQIWTQPALLSKWSMSSLQSVPFLPSGDLSKISGMDNLLHSWHQGVNDYHYNIVLCSASWEQTKYAVTVSSLPNGTPSAHTVTYSTLHSTQPKDQSFRIFYLNHYLLIKNLYKKFC